MWKCWCYIGHCVCVCMCFSFYFIFRFSKKYLAFSWEIGSTMERCSRIYTIIEYFNAQFGYKDSLFFFFLNPFCSSCGNIVVTFGVLSNSLFSLSMCVLFILLHSLSLLPLFRFCRQFSCRCTTKLDNTFEDIYIYIKHSKRMN